MATRSTRPPSSGPTTRRSAATIPAGAAPARSTRSATGPSPGEPLTGPGEHSATARRLLAALHARDGEAVAAELHPEVVATGDKGTFEGVDAVVAWAKPSDDGHLVSRVEVDDVREVGDRHVAIAARRQWRWKDDPETVADEAPFAVLLEFRDGRIVRWRQNFASIVDAIDAIHA